MGKSEELLSGELGNQLKGKVQLIFTSPPFPLNAKKQYGNLQGDEYVQWLAGFAPVLADLLTENGSIVIELGNAWEPQKPIQSLLPLQALMSFVQHKDAKLCLCQEFVCYNPARLPSPAQWVTIERIRLTDSYTHIWWMAKNERPKADNRKVLRPYSKSTLEMQQRGDYNNGSRPSGHKLSKDSFLKNNGGSIMPNLIEIDQIDADKPIRLPENVFSISHTVSNDHYMRQCQEQKVSPHPARMPLQLIDFFIQFLTDPGDLVLDPFAGSNATGFCAERAARKWVGIEANPEYGIHSEIRFTQPT
ncbi:MAG: site-specific DNA-methyltransferase [Caldilineaceae bacterium]